MLYICIASILTSIVSLFTYVADVPNSLPVFGISEIVCVLSAIVLVGANLEPPYKDKILLVEQEKKEYRVLSNHMLEEGSDQYFVVSQENDEYHFFVRGDFVTVRIKIPVKNTEIKPCDLQHPNACVEETTMAKTFAPVAEYPKFLYNGVLFLGNEKKRKKAYGNVKTTDSSYVLYLPKNAVIVK